MEGCRLLPGLEQVRFLSFPPAPFVFGGVALWRVVGSYPALSRFDSCRFHQRFVSFLRQSSG